MPYLTALLLLVVVVTVTTCSAFLPPPLLTVKHRRQQQRNIEMAKKIQLDHHLQTTTTKRRFPFPTRPDSKNNIFSLYGSGSASQDVNVDSSSNSRFDKACAAFEAAHMEDPRTITITTIDDGKNKKTTLPYSVHYHRRMAYWLDRLTTTAPSNDDDDADDVPGQQQQPSEAVRLAVRCQHIRRWMRPRSDYPKGLASYKKWRTELQKFHAQQATDILLDCGYSTEMTDKVTELLCKKNLLRQTGGGGGGGDDEEGDSDVQLLEDVICVVFLENEYTAFIEDNEETYDDDKLVNIVQKTWKKMSPRGHEAALQLADQLSERGLRVVQRALQEDDKENKEEGM